MGKSYFDMGVESLNQGDLTKAKVCFAKAYEEDPENASARYMAAYIDVKDASAVVMQEKVAEFISAAQEVLSKLNGGAEDEEDLFDLLVTSTEQITQHVHKVMWDHSKEIKGNSELLSKYNTQRNACEKDCINLIYKIADAAALSANEAVKALAVTAWKNAIAAQQLYPYCGADKTLPEKYAEKIKAVDPTYTLPKKTGCISFG